MVSDCNGSPPSYNLSAWLYLRALGLIFIIAFLSWLCQIIGLIGANGILPAHAGLHAERLALPGQFWLLHPTLFWFNDTDLWLQGLTVAGLVFAILLALGIFSGPSLIFCWLIYLSIKNVGGDFSNFQWDSLLLESAFLGMFLVPLQRKNLLFGPITNASVLTNLLLRWLLFRVLVCSGLVKILNGSANWKNLQVFNSYYETQLLPNSLAWYAHQMPEWLAAASALMTFWLELAVPFFLFVPSRRVRMTAGVVLILLQVVMFATGNHGFINPLTAALCLTVFDDQALEKIPWLSRLQGDTNALVKSPTGSSSKRTYKLFSQTAIGVYLLLTCLASAESILRKDYLPLGIRAVVATSAQFGICGVYALYPVVETSRLELIIEGSDDLVHWSPYQFKYKIGNIHRAPPMVAPYQPRLDWRMRFAALAQMRRSPLVRQFVSCLLAGDPEVLKLIEVNPFPAKPPAYVRVDEYVYRFTDSAEKTATGNWWKRWYVGRYFGPVSRSGKLIAALNTNGSPHFDGIRLATFAGSWYPASQQQLQQLFQYLFKRAEEPGNRKFDPKLAKSASANVRAILVPHAAYDYSSLVAARAYQAVDPKSVKRVFLIGMLHPSTQLPLQGAALSLSTEFATPIGNLRIDQASVSELLKNSLFKVDEQAHQQEHSLEMQLPFIRQRFGDVPIVPILLGSFKNEGDLSTVARSIQSLLKEGDLIVLSGDMTHYGKMYAYEPHEPGQGNMHDEVEALDRRAYSFVKNSDASGLWHLKDQMKGNMCSFEPLYVALKILPKAKVTIADYSTSQDSGAGIKSFEDRRCVGYLALILSE
jgi:lipase maturation factor 1